MKKILLSILFLVACHQTCFAAFSFSRTVTVDHTKVGSSDATNFPVGVIGTFTYLKVVGSGGNVQNASGFDIGFYSSPSCSSGKLNWETVFWKSTTGVVSYWVQVPTVSSSVDTVFYMCYGDSTITTDQSNATGTWDTNYKAVYHFGDGTTISANDSTSNANTLTNTGPVTATAGPNGMGAASFNGTTQFFTHTGAPFTAPPSTMEGLFNPVSNTTTGQIVGVQRVATTAAFSFELRKLSNTHLRAAEDAAAGTAADTTAVYSAATWQYGAGIFTSLSSRTVYLDANAGVTASSTAVGTVPDTIVIGKRQDGTDLYSGSLAEIRISNIARSVDWKTATDNSMINPSTFSTIGSQVNVPKGGATLNNCTIMNATIN